MQKYLPDKVVMKTKWDVLCKELAKYSHLEIEMVQSMLAVAIVTPSAINAIITLLPLPLLVVVIRPQIQRSAQPG